MAPGGGEVVDLEAGPGAREVGVARALGGRRRLEVDLEAVLYDLSRRTGGLELEVAVHRRAQLADQQHGVARAQRGQLVGVHVLHAAWERQLHVARDRDLGAQPQLADQAAQVVLGVGAEQVAAGAARERVEEQQVGASAESDGLHAGAGERLLEVAQQLVGRERTGGGVAVAEIDDEAFGLVRALRTVDAGVGPVEGLGGAAHHAAEVAGAGEDLLVEEGVDAGHRLRGRGEAAGRSVTGGVAREHGHAVVLAERGRGRLKDAARDGPQLGRHAVAAVEYEGVVDGAVAGRELEVRLEGEHEVGLAVAIEVGLGVLALVGPGERDVDAEVVDGPKALFMGRQLDALRELATVELSHRGGDRGEAVGR